MDKSKNNYKYIIAVSSFILMAVAFSIVNSVNTILTAPVINARNFSIGEFSLLFTITAITVAILNAMWIWNDYLLPYLVIGLSTKYKTIPVVIQMLVGSNGNRDMGAMMAMLVLAIIPIIIFYLACQKHIIEGVVAGAVKG